MAEYMHTQLAAAMRDYDAQDCPCESPDAYVMQWIQRNAAEYRRRWLSRTVYVLYHAVMNSIAAETMRDHYTA